MLSGQYSFLNLSLACFRRCHVMLRGRHIFSIRPLRDSYAVLDEAEISGGPAQFHEQRAVRHDFDPTHTLTKPRFGTRLYNGV